MSTTAAPLEPERSDLLPDIEQARLRISKATTAAKKSQLGQYFTPKNTAAFMASLFTKAEGKCRLLDAGAGIGSLSSAFLGRHQSGEFRFESIEVDAFEIDESLHATLSENLTSFQQSKIKLHLYRADFIHTAAEKISHDLFASAHEGYTHAILNPPYKKMSSASAHRLALRRVGIETVNLYSAFISLALALLQPGGQLVAIIPRSFCNGPYYRPFRDFILERAAIRSIHLFSSRNKAFKDDDVLQENVIIALDRGIPQHSVVVSTSTDDSFSDLTEDVFSFERIVRSNDSERIIHIPTSRDNLEIENCGTARHALSEIGVSVSTGPVVDFRLKDHLRDMPGAGTVPLLYPNHFDGNGIRWPIEGAKKPNAIELNQETRKWLYPNGHYCVVRRFSSKEEKKRIVASVVDPDRFGGSPLLGFENHLNIFHEKKHGLPKPLAYGLAAFLNSTAVDEYFRNFNGHTQVNATDLKVIRYPSRAALMALGEWAMNLTAFDQEKIDAAFGAFIG